MSQFEFLVMTEKDIFVYKLFLSLNISDFNLLLCESCNHPPEKVTILFPSNLPLKVEVLLSSHFLKISLEAHPPLPLPQNVSSDFLK